MDDNYQKIKDLQVNILKENLLKRNFECTIVDDGKQAKELVRSLIEKGSSVGLGGSMTLVETGILDMLYEMDIDLQDRYKEGLDRKGKDDVLRKSFSADYFLTSTNAITLNGQLINVDGNGNRVAAMSFGPKKVLVITGTNKIVNTLEEGFERIKMIAGPANCVRLHKDTPCVEKGICTNCPAGNRICSSYSIINDSNTPKRIHVILVKEDLGY